jgi:hypothetical protein
MAPKIPPPSKIHPLSFPVFGLSWYGSQSLSALAYCGGGGSSKTGVFNKIAILLTAEEGVERTVEISTGDALCFGIHLFRPVNCRDGLVRLLACVGDEVFSYGIPIQCSTSEDSNDETKEEATLLASVNVGSGYGANVATYTALFQQGKFIHCVAVGCENGLVLLYQLDEEKREFTPLSQCQGHTKAICAVNFHPQGLQVLSSAKDGTARIFSTMTGEQLAVMECEVHDPKGPSPKSATTTTAAKDPRMMKRPLQILVRGCAYGDLEGRTIYTIASGKRGAAYLTKWKTLVPLSSGAPSAPAAPSNETKLSIRQEYRIQCSSVPISATSLSSDGTLLSLGSVEGSILLYNLETRRVVKTFQGHDLPVTCLASRPIPNVLMLPGELEGGVNYDVVSASADNRLGKWTLQRKSRIQTVRQRRQAGGMESLLWSIVRVPLLILGVIFMMAIHDVLDLCQEEMGLNALIMDVNAAGHCVYREVLWADGTRAGVRSVPE